MSLVAASSGRRSMTTLFLSADRNWLGARNRRLLLCSDFWIGFLQKKATKPSLLTCTVRPLVLFFDLSLASTGKALICNTESRRMELCEELLRVVSEGRLAAKQAQRLRGRMQFAESQLFGRTGKRCLRVLADFSEGRRSVLTCKDKFFLQTFRSFLEANVPREVQALSPENVLVFTDACYEAGHPTWPCGLGGVLFAGGQVRFFSLEVDSELRKLLGEGVKRQIIFEVETLAAIISADLWQGEFGNKRVVLFVDNEGTKFSLLKGLSDNPSVDAMAELFATLECNLHSMIWIARVPSSSNVADPPSRGITNIPLLANATDVSSLAKKKLSAIVAQISKWGRRLSGVPQMKT